MSDERAYLLERCLRLEAQIVTLKYERAESWPLPRIRREVHADDVEQMRTLRQRGLAYNAIARRMGWSFSTVYRYTHMVQP